MEGQEVELVENEEEEEDSGDDDEENELEIEVGNNELAGNNVNEDIIGMEEDDMINVSADNNNADNN